MRLVIRPTLTRSNLGSINELYSSLHTSPDERRAQNTKQLSEFLTNQGIKHLPDKTHPGMTIFIADLPPAHYLKRIIDFIMGLNDEGALQLAEDIRQILGSIEHTLKKPADFFNRGITRIRRDAGQEEGRHYHRVMINDFLWASIDTATGEAAIRIREDHMNSDILARHLLMPTLFKKLKSTPAFIALFSKDEGVHTFFAQGNSGIYCCVDLLRDIRNSLKLSRQSNL
jgi:hypothetical protein